MAKQKKIPASNPTKNPVGIIPPVHIKAAVPRITFENEKMFLDDLDNLGRGQISIDERIKVTIDGKKFGSGKSIVPDYLSLLEYKKIGDLNATINGLKNIIEQLTRRIEKLEELERNRNQSKATSVLGNQSKS